jgi:predicted CXXCH cytochrome family protein
LSIRRVLVIVSVSSAALLVGPACSPSTRYRVLSFFFDGVPEPGTKPTVGYASPYAGFQDEGAEPGAPPRPPGQLYSHPPYRENRCRSCHDVDSGGVWRTDREGLCESCHQDLYRNDRYVHGPAAINACLDCHHYHGSTYPHMLLDEPTAICQRCHEIERLVTCEFRTSGETQTCTDCHAAHGGNDRFFLKRGES